MALPSHATASQRISYVLVRIVAGFGFVFLIAPILAIIPISFSSGSFLSYPLPGFSLKWYEAVLTPYPWLSSLRNSLIIGSATMVIATILGTMAAVGLQNLRFKYKALLTALLVSPLAVPVVVSGVALYFFFASVGLLGTFAGMILAHTVLATPFVVITVSVTLQGFDPTLVQAALSLGANRFEAFRSVTLPIIMPGVVSGAIFAFITSFDEIVVALFIAAPSQFTLPRQLFAGVRDKLDPSIVAVAVLLLVVSTLLILVLELLRWRTERLTSQKR
ncbi:MAG: ABC transporter permease [Rhodobacteraceae bacterium]|nr:ABC transporter permease [Paracoccaceae bacterium]